MRVTIRFIAAVVFAAVALGAAASPGNFDYDAFITLQTVQTLPDGRTVQGVTILTMNHGTAAGPAYTFSPKVIGPGGQEVCNFTKTLGPLPASGIDQLLFQLIYPKPVTVIPGKLGTLPTPPRTTEYTFTHTVSLAGDTDPTNNSRTRSYTFKLGGTPACQFVPDPRPKNAYDYRTSIDKTPRFETLPDGGTVARATIDLVNDGPLTGPKYKFSIRVTRTGGQEVCNSQSQAEWDPLPKDGLRTYTFKVTYPKPDVIVIGGKPVASAKTTEYTITATMIPVARAGDDTDPLNNSDTTSFALNLGGTPSCSWSP